MKDTTMCSINTQSRIKMTQRSILAGKNQTIVIKVGAHITVKGHDSDTVIAETNDTWGLTLEQLLS